MTYQNGGKDGGEENVKEEKIIKQEDLERKR